MRLCVFCGSSFGARAVYREAAEEFGGLLARRGIELVYGGAHAGLMGALADAVLAGGGQVIGVIPEALVGRELAHSGLTDLRIVGSMHERKALMASLSDGFVALPGGIGTFEELFEIWTWAQLGYHAKPVGLLNVAGFYDGLLSFAATMGEVGFLRPQHQGLLIASDDLDDLLAKMAAFVPGPTIVQMKAEEL